LSAGAILAMVSHAMIPEAYHKGGSASVMPVVFGFLFALYLALEEVEVKPAQQGTLMPPPHHAAISGETLLPEQWPKPASG
jgi:hypothetical protein